MYKIKCVGGGKFLITNINETLYLFPVTKTRNEIIGWHKENCKGEFLYTTQNRFNLHDALDTASGVDCVVASLGGLFPKLAYYYKPSNSDLKNSNKLIFNEDSFLSGIVLALIKLWAHDSHVQACEITEEIGGLKVLKAYIKKHGSELEQDVYNWIKTGKK